MVKSAGAEPSMIAEMILGETNASGVNKRICLSTLHSRFAIADKDSARVRMRSSTQSRAFAIALSSASRFSELIVGRREGEWRTPLAAPRVGADHDTLMTVCSKLSAS